MASANRNLMGGNTDLKIAPTMALKSFACFPHLAIESRVMVTMFRSYFWVQRLKITVAAELRHSKLIC